MNNMTTLNVLFTNEASFCILTLKKCLWKVDLRKVNRKIPLLLLRTTIRNSLILVLVNSLILLIVTTAC